MNILIKCSDACVSQGNTLVQYSAPALCSLEPLDTAVTLSGCQTADPHATDMEDPSSKMQPHPVQL